MKQINIFAIFITVVFFSSCTVLKDGSYSLNVLSTNDVHGQLFDKAFNGMRNPKGSLFAAYTSIKNVRDTSETILIDAGNALSDGAANFYYNYVNLTEPHLYPNIAGYMGYDVFIPGTDDRDGGLFSDKVKKEFRKNGVKVLEKDDFIIIKKGGLRVAVLGSINALKAASKKHPDAVIAKADAKSSIEDLNGIDLLLVADDHRKVAEKRGDTYVLDAGSYAKNIGIGYMNIEVHGGKIISKKWEVSCPSIDIEDADAGIKDFFESEYSRINDFVKEPVGELRMRLNSRDAYKGASEYMNFYHTLALSQEGVDISMAAPLAVDGIIEPEEINYSNLSKLYPFANKLLVVRMSGKEIKAYLEASYDAWIRTMNSGEEHIFRLKESKDYRTNKLKSNFEKSPAHFDSAGGLIYTVDVTKPLGERINISSFADGGEFVPEKDYNVGITSYRSVGAGGLLAAAGIRPDKLGERIVLKYPEFKTLLYNYIKKEGEISPAKINDVKVVGTWRFIPEQIATEAIERDLGLMFDK